MNGPSFQELAFAAFLAAEAYHEKAKAKLSQINLTPSHVRLLNSVALHPDFPIIDHARALQVLASTAGYGLRSMQRRGLVDEWAPKTVRDNALYYRTTAMGRMVLQDARSAIEALVGSVEFLALGSAVTAPGLEPF